jgi:predicted ATP-grasp superfamily ATP-dependent carboligase
MNLQRGPRVIATDRRAREERKWVLVTDGREGRGRDVVAAVRGLAAGGYTPAATVVTPSWRSAPSRYCARRVQTPPVTDESYAEAIRRELASGRYLTVIPASEEALIALGVSVPHLLDKTAMSKAAEEADIPVPPLRLFGGREDIVAAARELDYPVVIKPTFRRYWAFRVDHPDQLQMGMVVDGPVVVQPYVDAPLRAISGIVWKGRLLAAVHERWLRIWPVHCGLASAAETVSPDTELEARLLVLMTGYEGLFCAQFVGPYLIDLNLRIHSSHPLAVVAGVNLVALYCDLLRGEVIRPVRAKPGVFYRWLEGDVRHVARAVRDGEVSVRQALRALWPQSGAAHSTESLRDPIPMVERIMAGVARRVARRECSGALPGGP